jgi:hypothetical protein
MVFKKNITVMFAMGGGVSNPSFYHVNEQEGRFSEML